ncbi:MAG: 30S ribosomal protein S7 [Armatimonadetes bacterium]|nr:30S ribosomal protein S7 [Armatimonadota bacterium]MBS1712577.1 30S ribosomal protein S7 [Armatimonadota bacterium]MBX3110179.1 30S ribosomal protein S7 [Fimbriimonadaceae bacterium]
MPRKGPVPVRRILPDPVHGSVLLQRFINRLMLDGKKSKAEHIVYTSLQMAAAKVEAEPLEVFEKAMANVMPQMEVRPRRVGGQTYQVPMEVRQERKSTLALRWFVTFARKRSGKGMIDKLAGEFVDAYNNTGNAVKKKEDTHRMADANRAFSHYRF